MDPTSRWLLVLFLAGAALRLAVMPFTLHFDAYQIYSRAAEAAYHNQWFGFTSQFLIQELHNIWLLLIRPLLPDSVGIWSPTASTLGVGATRADYERFLAYDHLFRLIFLMKLPYVVADLACAWVLTRLVPPGRRLATAAFWLLNPLVIFSSAIYGRHDSVAILLVLLSLLVVRGGSDARRVAGLGLLGAATLMRFFPIVVVPYFLLAFRRSRRQLALFLALLAGMAALVEAAGLATSGKSTFLTVISSYEHLQYWFDASFYLRFDDWIFVFPVAYTILLLWVIERGMASDEYPRLSAVAFLLVFGLTFFHPHYAIWLVPFLALTIAWQPRMVVYHAIQVVCVLVYSAQWGAWTTWNLLEPVLGDRVASLPDPVEAISAQIEPRIFFGLFRSLLTAISLWMAWRLLRELGRRPIEPRGPKIAEAAGSPAGKVALIGLLLPVLVLTTGCTTRVTGYSSPIAHDYAGLTWASLDAPMAQPLLAGTGIAASVADDPRTTPAQLQQRQAALPVDARMGTLDTVRVALRLDGEPGRAWQTAARVQLRYAPDLDPRFPERDFHAWDAADGWLPNGGVTSTQSFVSPYDRLDGVTVRVATFGGDLAPGPARVGDQPVDARALPIDGKPLVTLPPGAEVEALGSAEGWARVRLMGGREGFVPLDALAVVTPPATRPAGPLRVTLLDESGRALREATVAPEDLHDNSHLTVRFEPVEDAAGRDLTFRFVVPAGATLRVTAGHAFAEGARDGGTDDLVFRPVYAEQLLLADAEADALPRAGDWVALRDLPDVRPGTAMTVTILPGAGPDASILRVGTTPGRVPYGGWPAVGLPEQGSLGVQARYRRDVDLGGIARSGASALRAGARADAGFAALLAVAVAGLAVAAVAARPRQGGEVS